MSTNYIGYISYWDSRRRDDQCGSRTASIAFIIIGFRNYLKAAILQCLILGHRKTLTARKSVNFVIDFDRTCMVWTLPQG